LCTIAAALQLGLALIVVSTAGFTWNFWNLLVVVTMLSGGLLLAVLAAVEWRIEKRVDRKERDYEARHTYQAAEHGECQDDRTRG
jgi:ABC-type transport system involved in Fe-S cluster assembly fused permease/ATPase subunit